MKNAIMIMNVENDVSIFLAHYQALKSSLE